MITYFTCYMSNYDALKPRIYLLPHAFSNIAQIVKSIASSSTQKEESIETEGLRVNGMIDDIVTENDIQRRSKIDVTNVSNDTLIQKVDM